jgi:hypothetical protein
MAIEIDSVSIVGLNRIHLIQLASYIDDYGEDGDKFGHHFGRKDHFDKRHEDLEKWIEDVLRDTAGRKIKESK